MLKPRGERRLREKKKEKEGKGFVFVGGKSEDLSGQDLSNRYSTSGVNSECGGGWWKQKKVRAGRLSQVEVGASA